MKVPQELQRFYPFPRLTIVAVQDYSEIDEQCTPHLSVNLNHSEFQ